ncbi:hypothetical protein [Massilia horti]|uniref:Pyridoxamine 5'-phosphate oxidase putative domain-containing protein n=1 Tax=Massilia horti TaxID=2562153 RepID=A0A4Y9T5X3_9BURK|nr:hypothetical protein [Massilia horti]TFW34008.1 hypothetical protein E4O92_04965 [Massilia horti]
MIPAHEALPPPLFDAELAAFMQGGISLNIGSCGPDRRPSVARAFGCRIAADRRQVRMLVSSSHAAQVLAHVRATGVLAAVFSEPSTYRTVQLKGVDATVEPATPEDLAAVAACRAGFVAELEPLGYAPDMVRALLGCPDADIVAVRFTPSAAFSQTPGPDAGRALGVAS